MDRTLAEKAGGVSDYLIKPDCNEETGQISWVRIPLNSKIYLDHLGDRYLVHWYNG